MKINAKALCWTALAYLAAASGSNAQVLFGNAYGSVNAGSHPVGSPAPSIPLPFTIGAGTKVVGVRVLTTGVTGISLKPRKAHAAWERTARKRSAWSM